MGGSPGNSNSMRLRFDARSRLPWTGTVTGGKASNESQNKNDVTYAERYSQANLAFADKYSRANLAFADKYSQANLKFADKYSQANNKFADKSDKSPQANNKNNKKQNQNQNQNQRNVQDVQVDQVSGPEGWLGYTSLLPCHYFVHSVGSVCEYRVDVGKETTLKGTGFAHVEGNHGTVFPEGWVWSQGVNRFNNVSMSLVLGKFSIGGLNPLSVVLFVRTGHLTRVFRSTDLDRIHIDCVDASTGRVSLTVSHRSGFAKSRLKSGSSGSGKGSSSSSSDGDEGEGVRGGEGEEEVTVEIRGPSPG